MLRIVAIRLLFPIHHGHIGCNLAIGEPGQKLAGSIALVGSHADWFEPKPFLGSFLHLVGRMISG